MSARWQTPKSQPSFYHFRNTALTMNDTQTKKPLWDFQNLVKRLQSLKGPQAENSCSEMGKKKNFTFPSQPLSEATQLSAWQEHPGFWLFLWDRGRGRERSGACVQHSSSLESCLSTDFCCTSFRAQTEQAQYSCLNAAKTKEIRGVASNSQYILGVTQSRCITWGFYPWEEERTECASALAFHRDAQRDAICLIGWGHWWGAGKLWIPGGHWVRERTGLLTAVHQRTGSATNRHQREQEIRAPERPRKLSGWEIIHRSTGKSHPPKRGVRGSQHL